MCYKAGVAFMPMCIGSDRYDGRGNRLDKTATKPGKGGFWRFFKKIFGVKEYESQEWCDGRDIPTELNQFGIPNLSNHKQSVIKTHPHHNLYRPLSS
ncbi:MAG: hypothetical protein L6Q29_02870 [Candidatus Pacebacteria bacterium]|nr:hypothetical protein [Candidatus Paceibacterota bacterium]